VHIMARRRQAQQLPGRITTADKPVGTIPIRPVIELAISAVANWRRASIDTSFAVELGDNHDSDGGEDGSAHDPMPGNRTRDSDPIPNGSRAVSVHACVLCPFVLPDLSDRA
jgi:hypothetical protein